MLQDSSLPRAICSDSTSNQYVSPPVTLLDDLLDRRAQAGMMVEQALDLLWGANEVLPEASLRSYLSGKRSSVFGYRGEEESKKECVKHMDVQVWLQAIEKTNLPTILNSDQLSEMRDDIRENAPPFERDVVITTFISQFENRHENFRKGMVNLFQRLQRSRYKTNKAFKVDKKLILENALVPASECGNGWDGYHRMDSVFNDLWRFTQICAGDDPGSTTYNDQPCHKIQEARMRGESVVSFTHFNAQLFKKGTIHIVFTNLNVLERINDEIKAYFGASLAHGE